MRESRTLFLTFGECKEKPAVICLNTITCTDGVRTWRSGNVESSKVNCTLSHTDPLISLQIKTFIPAGEAAELGVDFEVAACLRAVVVVLAELCGAVEPDTGEQVELLIGCNAIADGLQPVFGNAECRFFAGLKWRHGSSPAARSAAIAVQNWRQFTHRKGTGEFVSYIGPAWPST